jgi:hypothetical protein
MSPQNERRRLLGVAVDAATDLLDDPVDYIAIEGDVIEARAGARRVRGSWGYSDSYSPDGSPLLGGGHWWVNFGPVEPMPAGGAWALLAKVTGARR